MALPCLSWLLLSLSLNAPPTPAGRPVEDFQARDYRGAERRLSDWKDRKLVVVVFLGVDCPLARLYGPRLAALAKEYEPRGVAFVGVDANDGDAPTAIGRYARLHAIGFPILKDVGNVLADRLGGERTPEAFVLDGERVVRYRGRIDDQYGVGTQRPKATHNDLTDALDALLAGKSVRRPVTAAPGCLISRVAAAPKAGRVTYCRDVAPLLQKHCQSCHRPGQIAPFALTDYKQAAGWARMIQEVLEEGRMPPWHADPRHGKFSNDPSLKPEDKRRILAWVEAGCPEGDPKDLPPPASFPSGWSIPEPDLVVPMPEPFRVPAEGVIEYQYFAVDLHFKEDRWVQMAEIRPGNRAVVHHCNVFLQTPDDPHMGETGELGSYCLAAAAPGTPPLVLPPGMAKRVPAGSRLVFVVHYTAVGSEQTDQTSIGLRFADPKSVKKEVATKLMYDLDLTVPPGEAGHQVAQTWEVKRDVLLLAFFPHMHLRGKSFRYEAVYPDGRAETLLDVPRYDFNWQHRYVLAEPKRLPAGARLVCTAVYDNSANNPNNPDPAATVKAGTQSWDEMFNGYFDVCLADEDLTRPVAWNVAVWREARKVFRPRLAFVAVLAGGLFLGWGRLRRWARGLPPASHHPEPPQTGQPA
jgi:thiol-disulfide isomerase/thioredoxin